MTRTIPKITQSKSALPQWIPEISKTAGKASTSYEKSTVDSTLASYDTPAHIFVGFRIFQVHVNDIRSGHLSRVLERGYNLYGGTITTTAELVQECRTNSNFGHKRDGVAIVDTGSAFYILAKQDDVDSLS